MKQHCRARELLSTVTIVPRPGFPPGAAWIVDDMVVVSADLPTEEQDLLALRALAKQHQIECACAGIARDAAGA